MRTLFVMVLLVATAFSGVVEYGPQIGYWAPTGDVAEAYNGNLYVGAQLLVHLPLIAAEASVGYLSLKPDTEISGFSGHIIPVTAGIRSYLGPLYAAGGLEIDTQKITSEDADSTDNQTGGYLGLGFEPSIPFVADIDTSLRLHFVDFSDLWIGVTAGLNF